VNYKFIIVLLSALTTRHSNRFKTNWNLFYLHENN